jgi:hypothetical protein
MALGKQLAADRFDLALIQAAADAAEINFH